MTSLVLIVHQPFDRSRFEGPLLRELSANASVTLLSTAECGWPVPASALGDAAVLVFFVPARVLADSEPIDWGRYSGRRVLLDHDVVWDFVKYWIARSHPVRHVEEFHRHRFDTLVRSSGHVAATLREGGVDAHWLPKAADTGHFGPGSTAANRRGLGTFGTPYPARVALLRHLRARGVEIEVSARVGYEELPALLGGWLACLVCNMGIRVRLGAIGRTLYRLSPGRGVQLVPSHEVMAKNFEAAAAGCAVFMDHTEDLAPLGFVDGETALAYHDADVLVERIMSTNDDELREIAERAGALCRERHDWSHRAAELVRIVTADGARAGASDA